jgi:hypothetical protein
MEMREITWVTISTLISVLFSGNVFFVIRLVMKIESMEKMIYELREEVAVFKKILQNEGTRTHQ